ncbi:MAG: glycosyltransferase family 39 protein [Patescibacteria group bacterium]
MLTSLLHQYRASILLLILAFAFVTRILFVDQPEEYYFDEVYHSVTARLIAENDPRAFEWWNTAPEQDTAIDWLHPPVAKYIQASTVLLFGANSFGFRFSSVLFGVVVILLTYHVAQRLFNNTRLSLLAAALASFDGLLLAQSRITMNDIHVTAFILLSTLCFLTYLHNQNSKWLLLTGVITGITIATKWSGILILPAFVALLFFNWLASGNQIQVKKIAQVVGALGIIPLIVFISSYALMFAQGKDLAHFIELQKQVWWYQTTLSATHPAQSRPWEWVLNTSPVWYHVDYISDELRGNIYAQGNLPLYWLGAIAVLAASLHVARKKITAFTASRNASYVQRLQAITRSVVTEPVAPLVLLYFILWVPWLFSPRIMFFYHYAPAVPFMCILLAWWLLRLQQKIKHGSYLIWTAFLVIGVWFVAWYPYWTGVPTPIIFHENIYQYFDVWK